MPAARPSALSAALEFRRIAIIGRFASHGIAAPLANLAAFLAARGHEVVLEHDTASSATLPGYPTAPSGERVDVAIVIGGDGTMLSIARQLAPLDVPLIGINQGRLGFLTDIPLAAMENTLSAMLDGRYTEERRTLLEATILRAATGEETALALNDVAVSRGTLGGMIDVAVDIDGRFVYAMRSDGLIVSTPTGSTAYALSANGPIVHPAVPALLLVPVAPHALSNRPIAIDDASAVTITLIKGKDAAAHCDGQAHFALQEGDRVTIRRAPCHVRLLHPEGHDHFAMLRQKLHWGETPEKVHLD